MIYQFQVLIYITLVKILFEAIDKNLKGTFNIGSSEVFSKKKMICEFSRQMKKTLVNPCIKKVNSKLNVH